MSPDEVLVTTVAVIVGPLLWFIWLVQMYRAASLEAGRASVGVIALALVSCGLVIFVVLDTAASSDVIDAPNYQLMYLVLGLAWLRVSIALFPYLGLGARDDVIERGNGASLMAFVGALLGLTFGYAGGNIGDGPGWWVVVVCAALATGGLVVAWFLLTQLTPVVDTVAIDRDPAAGLRLGAFLAACGLVLGRSVAGNWESLDATVLDFERVLPVVALLVVMAALVERIARPTPERPRAPIVTLGLAPAAAYALIAIYLRY